MNPHPKKTVVDLVSFGIAAVLSLAGIALIWSAFWGQEGLRSTDVLRQELEMLQEKVLLLQNENEEMTKLIKRLELSREAQEDEIRKGLGMIKKDEVILSPVEKVQ